MVPTHFREADVAHVAGRNHLRDGSDGVFNGDVGVKAGRAIDVNVVDAEALERVGKSRLHGCGTGVVAEPGAVGAGAARRI